MVNAPRPRVLMSRCLEGDMCRYDGANIPDTFAGLLRQHAEVIDLCPEVGIGLGVPRPPIRLVVKDTTRRLIQPESGRDLSESMTRFSALSLEGIGPLDGALLKGRSPSCGLGDTKLYGAIDASEPIGRGHGLFAQALVDTHPTLPVSDEGSLSDLETRRLFLVRLYLRAWSRRAGEEPDGLLAPLRAYLARHEVRREALLERALVMSDSEAISAALRAALAQGPSTGATEALYPLALEAGA